MTLMGVPLYSFGLLLYVLGMISGKTVLLAAGVVLVLMGAFA